MLLSRDRQGNTPLHSAVQHGSSSGVVQTLVKLGGREALLARRDNTDCASVMMTALLRIDERLHNTKAHRDKEKVFTESRQLIEYLSRSMTQAPPTCMPPTDPQSCTEQIDTDRSAMIKYDHIVLAAVKLNDVALLERLLDTNAHARSQVGTAGNGAARRDSVFVSAVMP